jgi:N-acetylmuramoyl-L-alanine amidase
MLLAKAKCSSFDTKFLAEFHSGRAAGETNTGKFFFLNNLKRISNPLALSARVSECIEGGRHLIMMGIFCVLYSQLAYSFTLMIDPARDARDAGRIIDGNFERGITLQCAHELKRLLEETSPQARVLITRMPGEVLEPLQAIQYANRIGVDLYLSIHCYQERSSQAQITLYHFVRDPMADFIGKKSDILRFIPLDQTHIHWLPTTKHYAQQLQAMLSVSLGRCVMVVGAFGIPIKSLRGINAPALCIEFGLVKADDWHYYMRPLAESLLKLAS